MMHVSAAGMPPKGLEIIVPLGCNLEKLSRIQTLQPFAPEVLGFANALSQAILTSPSFRQHPDAIAFAYWARAARLKQLKTQFESMESTGLLVARGTAFHIAPSNVDTIFLYSLMISLLAGNKNIIRISSRDNDQMTALIALIARLLNEPTHAAMAERLAIVRYGRSAEVTQWLSDLCDLRIVWGGDTTIDAIRAIPLKPRAVEVCFADKVSLAVFDAAAYCAAANKQAMAKAFRNDSYWFGQMACSSPRMVVWKGTVSVAAEAARLFWDLLEDELKAADPDLSSMDFLNKLLAEQSFMVQLHGKMVATKSNASRIVDIASLADIPFEEHCGSGLFLQTRVDSLKDLGAYLTRRNQTIISLGIPSGEWSSFIRNEQPAGIDRIVEIGQALSFNTVWDGYSLLRAFSREISIAV